jgi:hypothetical protein
MNLEALKEIFRKANIVPVQTDGSAFENEAAGETVVGALDDYIEALKALRTPIVFICVDVLENDDFLYFSEEGEDQEVDDSTVVDLCRGNSELGKFKKYIGSVGLFKLSVSLQSTSLNYFIREEWYTDYERCWAAATDKLDEDRAVAEESSEVEKQARLENLLTALRGLINDRKFIGLPTQKAMLAYALHKIPDLDDLERSAVKVEIQDMHARIVAMSG